MKKITALVVALLLVGASFTPAFADGRRHHDRGNHYSHRHGVSPGLMIGLGALGLFGGILTYESLRYREPVIIDPSRACSYMPGPYVWNPNWQRWEQSWVLYCQ